MDAPVPGGALGVRCETARSATLASAHRRARRQRAGAEDGQTLPLICLFMVVLIGMCGLAIDLGNGYLQRQQAQDAADAAALAGAEAVPNGNYLSAAQQMEVQNGKPGDQVAVSFNGTDSV